MSPTTQPTPILYVLAAGVTQEQILSLKKPEVLELDLAEKYTKSLNYDQLKALHVRLVQFIHRTSDDGTREDLQARIDLVDDALLNRFDKAMTDSRYFLNPERYGLRE